MRRTRIPGPFICFVLLLAACSGGNISGDTATTTNSRSREFAARIGIKVRGDARATVELG